ncbi:Ppx/GppA family phosphatase [Paracoccus sp. p3-h83]|uniref:Ppx/GppA family phosphatase n=1 Tax=Paracoccus sp. p3-h83 TaxID=3342805 RepID=UPI0035B90983
MTRTDARKRRSAGRWEPFGGPLFENDRARALNRVGVVDVGSNSVRMVVFDGAARSPAYFYNEKVMAGLGQGLATTGRLNPEGKTRAASALARFAAMAKAMDVSSMSVVATAAVREAEDGPAFRAEVESATGLKIHVIDGAEEARLSAQGVLLGWPGAQGLVCDIGGNSMELAEVAGGKIGRRATSALGPFRLQQVKPAKLKDYIRKTMQGLADQMGTDHDRIYLVGGSWRAIARLDMERRAYPMTVLHEYRMTPADVAATVAWIGASDMADLRARTGTSAARMELVPLAAQVLAELVATFQPREIDISSYGIREGLLYEQMPPALRKRDPLIEAARHMEKQMSRMPGSGKRVYGFLMPLFDELPAHELRLVKAACLLHDITWRAHPDYRAEACFDNVTRANLAALSHGERVFLGVALLHRYKNSRSGSPMAPLFALLSDENLRRAEILGKALRFAAMFAAGDPEKAASLERDRKANTLTLRLSKRGQVLFGEVAEARFRSLASSIGAEPVIVAPNG